VIINKINEIEQSKDTHVWTSGNMAPLRAAPAIAPAPLDMANHIEECMTAAIRWDHRLEDDVEQYIVGNNNQVGNDNQVPF